MLSASIEFRNKIANNSKVLVKATLKLRNSHIVELDGDDIIMGGMSFTEATSSGSSFDIGATVIGKFECQLNNFDGRFDDYDFTDAQIMPSIGMALENGSTEWIRKGVYNVQQPDSYGGTIKLDCYDNMSKLDKPYEESSVGSSVQALIRVQDIARACGLTFISTAFNNDSMQLTWDSETDVGSMTYREVLGYICQATGNHAKCDNNGNLVLGWYSKDAFSREQTLDGKWFDGASPYASGDTADGGDFTNYGSGDRYEGGDFSVNFDYAIVSAISSQTIGLDDVVITGLRVTSEENPDDEVEDDQKYDVAQFGADGYVLEIKDNPFIPYGKALEIAQAVGPHVVDLRFRIFDVSALGTPVIEAGDPILIIDAAQKQYRSYITQLTYKPGAYESYSCAGETPARRSATANGPLSKAIIEFNKGIEREKTRREKAQEDLAKRLADSSGLYMTAEEQEGGSTIYYAHDKPTLEGSKIVWKITAEAIGISTDGGKSYPYGLDADGNTILNRIYTIGLDATYITAGRIKAQKGDNFWDLETGEFRMAFDGVRDSTGKTLNDVIAALEKTDADNFKELQDMVSDGVVSDAEKVAIDVMLKRIQAEQVEAVNLYNTIYSNSNLSGTPKTNLYNAKTTLYGTNNTTGSYGSLVTAINNVKNATTPSAVSSAMSTYETRYTSYQSNRNTFTQALQAAQLAIDTAVAEAKATAAVNSQTQQEVFNRLTGGGANQGLYLDKGSLYINATYIKTGTITDNVGYNYWNLTTGEFRLSPTGTKVGTSSSSQTLDAYISSKSGTDSFANATPEQVFNKLTRNGTVQGITLSGNSLYINASYINAGTLSGNYIRTGIIQGNNSNSAWNLDTGAFQTHSEITSPQHHDLYMRYSGSTLLMVMDSTTLGKISLATSVNGDPNHHTCNIVANELVISSASDLAVGFTGAASSSTSFYYTLRDTTFAVMGSFTYETVTTGGGGFKVTFKNRTISVRQGHICSVGELYNAGSFTHVHA